MSLPLNRYRNNNRQRLQTQQTQLSQQSQCKTSCWEKVGVIADIAGIIATVIVLIITWSALDASKSANKISASALAHAKGVDSQGRIDQLERDRLNSIKDSTNLAKIDSSIQVSNTVAKATIDMALQNRKTVELQRESIDLEWKQYVAINEPELNIVNIEGGSLTPFKLNYVVENMGKFPAIIERTRFEYQIEKEENFQKVQDRYNRLENETIQENRLIVKGEGLLPVSNSEGIRPVTMEEDNLIKSGIGKFYILTCYVYGNPHFDFKKKTTFLININYEIVANKEMKLISFDIIQTNTSYLR